MLDCRGKPGLEPAPRDEIDEERHDRRQSIPQPRLEQKYQREQDEQRSEQAAHRTALGSGLVPGGKVSAYM